MVEKLLQHSEPPMRKTKNVVIAHQGCSCWLPWNVCQSRLLVAQPFQACFYLAIAGFFNTSFFISCCKLNATGFQGFSLLFGISNFHIGQLPCRATAGSTRHQPCCIQCLHGFHMFTNFWLLMQGSYFQSITLQHQRGKCLARTDPYTN